MNAFILKEKNAPNLLELQQVNKPVLKPNEVLIETRAVSLNPVDYKVTQGAFNLDTPRIVGIDVAGEVIEVGESVTTIKIGARVCAMVNIFETGSFADFVAVDHLAVSTIPENVSFEEAATIPCAGITAWQAINEKINIRKGQTVFITAGGGGVGGYAIQLAKMKGAKIITTASKDFDRIKALGADYIIDYKSSDVLAEVMKITNGKGVDYMIDCISGKNASDYAGMLRFNGTIVCITGLPEKYPFAPFSKAAGMIEVALVAAYTGGDTNSLAEIAAAGSEIATLIGQKAITANVTKEIPFNTIPEGLQQISLGNTSGKIVAVK